ncbi:glycoside hydrolase family 57 protein [Candidatus Formimonas warabiya]|uniref:Glycoside hydrolase n=1 Tax=Formimonas warabiya TaxID=1761012 RepID=A0A3G1KM57_FORW1|nr:1,4-alpha-glucan branching protein domain-containing protein [Candidatus Formimonas warabiya]ATW23489.1 glycoside hydrolase [Candidatus Formimonas warabiya]
MAKGYLSLVLHAHLPYIRHTEHAHFLEERWLHEAITDCYIPLINMMDRLANEAIPYKITMSLTPPLLTMLSDPLLQQRYQNHINMLIELTEKELLRLKNQPQFLNLALMYHQKFTENRRIFCDVYRHNLIHGFKKHMEAGNLEIITSGATHAYFPLAEESRKSVKAQVATAVNTHQQFLGRYPEGIWLPECGYFPGDDLILQAHGIKYFFVDAHGILYASRRPKYACYAPIFCPSGVAAFARDPESSKQVWSMTEGYPGDYDYREYYRDIGYDLDFGYIWPYIHPEGIRLNTGIKYYRITGKTMDKEVYQPDIASAKAAQHARNFKFNREKQIEYLSCFMDRKPLIVSPYDAELFGHWWFEGPQFLEHLIRSIATDGHNLELISPLDYLAMYPKNQITEPCMSSWGDQGYHDVWLDESNQWIYPHLHQAASRMSALAAQFPHADACLRRTLNQAARELLLAQSSDWAFIMKTGSMVQYAVHRTKKHLNNFNNLYGQILGNSIDPDYLTGLEQENNIFPFIDYHVFQ